MYSEIDIHCVSCGSLIPRKRRLCPACGQPNLYRSFIPGDHSAELHGKELDLAESRPRGLAVRGDVPSTQPFQKTLESNRSAETIPHPPQGRPEPSRTELVPDDASQRRTIEVPRAGRKPERSTMPMEQIFPAYLARVEPPGRPENYRLARGTVTIGFDATTCELILREDTISRQHAEFSCSEDDHGRPVVRVRDLESTNGTFVNGERIGSEPHRLRDGDEIRFADICYRFCLRRGEVGRGG